MCENSLKALAVWASFKGPQSHACSLKQHLVIKTVKTQVLVLLLPLKKSSNDATVLCVAFLYLH